MRIKFLSLLLLLVLALNAVGQQGSKKSLPSIDHLRTDITFLSDDKSDGRRTGTEGANRAARYIGMRFNEIELRQVSLGYKQTFPYIAGVELGQGNSMSVKFKPDSAEIGVPVETLWMPLGFSTNGVVTNSPLVFVGYGITAADLRYDDYAGVDVKNKVALAFEGTPDRDNPHGQFTRYEDVRWKAIAAKDKGAIALLVIASENNFNDDRLTKLQYDNMAGDAGLPVVVISQQTASRILGHTFESLSVAESSTDLSKRIMDMSAGKSSFSMPVKDTLITLRTDVSRREASGFNIIGVLDGSDPKLRNEHIIIGAHYDHLGRGGEGSLAPRSGEVHHGADDNASGVAGMLELARLFSRKGFRPKRSIIFIAFSGEEEGLIGSNYYVNNPLVVPLAQTVAMINMDMIGRLKDDKLIVGGVGTSPQWRDWISKANEVRADSKTGLQPVSATSTPRFTLTLNEDGYGPSDHSSFYSKQVPVLFFWTGTHEDYHKPSDTADKINYDGEARVVSLVFDVVQAIDKNEQRPIYAVAKSESTGRTMGFKVSLGTIPNYAESTDGLKLDGVRDDSPASKAGLKGGDVIVKLAGRDIKNVYDYTYALGEMKAGQEYEVELMRGTERLKLTIIPAARK